MSDVEHISTTANQVFSGFAFIGFILAIIPLPWHLQAWNTSTCLYMFWASIGCFNYFVNSVIWNNNAINVAPVWCDIAIRIQLACNIGIPAASLCINRRLFHISSVKSARITASEKRRGIIEDLAIGLLLPLIDVPLVYIAQAHRFDLFEQVGPLPDIPTTVFAFLFVLIPPLIIGLISGVYCCITIYRFNKRRTQFRDRLSSNNVSSNRYFRLMALAALEVCCTVPIATYFIYDSVQTGVIPWGSWKESHADYGDVILVPAVLWRSDPHTNFLIEFQRGLAVVCAYVFFGFFGFAEEARKNYHSAYTSIAKHVGYSTGSMTLGATSTNGTKSSSFGKGLISFGKTSRPVFVHQETTRTTDCDTLSSAYKDNSVYISTGSVFDEEKKIDLQP